MRRKKGQEQEAPATGDRRITPEEVQQIEFRLAFRGYNERDVDAFLDRITEDLSSYIEESQRLPVGSGSGVPTHGADGNEIVERARDEAASIIRRAEEQAATILAASNAGGAWGDTRSAVAPFLNKEREFLQGLGGLVQGHAEEIRQMVMAIRERAAAQEASSVGGAGAGARESEPDRGPEPAVTAGAGSDEADARFAPVEPASAAEIRERLEPAEARGTITLPDDEVEQPAQSEPVVVDSATEPVFSTEGAPATDRRERSLRELFWGEE